jgi:hypothetical protein
MSISQNFETAAENPGERFNAGFFRCLGYWDMLLLATYAHRKLNA